MTCKKLESSYDWRDDREELYEIMESGEVVIILSEEAQNHFPSPSIACKVEGGAFFVSGRFVFNKADFGIIHRKFRIRHLLPQNKEMK